MIKRPVTDLSVEERTAIEKGMISSGAMSLTMAFLEKCSSEEFLDAMGPYARMASHSFTLNMHEWFGIEGNDMERIADVCHLYDMLMAGGMKEVERSAESIVRIASDCPFRSYPKENCIWAHEMFLSGFCDTINPDYECRFSQMITRGDPVCIYTIRRKSQGQDIDHGVSPERPRAP
jgi:hypothetical protein